MAANNIQLPVITPRLQLKIVEIVEQRVAEYVKWSKSRIDNLEKALVAVVRHSTNLLMKAVNNMTKLVQSRLMDAMFIRKASLRDPSLSEKGCEIATVIAIESAVVIFFDIIVDSENNPKHLLTPEEKLYRCNDSKCDLGELIKDTFIQGRQSNPDYNLFMYLICCPRHQFVLESYTTIEIMANICLKNEEKTAYINLIRVTV